MGEKLFILYDGRAALGDTDRASVYVTASAEDEARQDSQDPAWQDGVWYEYDYVGGSLVNERIRFDLGVAKGV